MKNIFLIFYNAIMVVSSGKRFFAGETALGVQIDVKECVYWEVQTRKELPDIRTHYEQGRSVPTVEKLHELLHAVCPHSDIVIEESNIS